MSDKIKLITGGATAFAVVVSLALPSIKSDEGLRLSAYRDPVGIPTICYGETLNVAMGDRKTVTQCDEMLKRRLGVFLSEMRACTTQTLHPKTEAAMLSFAYNVGTGTYCKNMAKPRINHGKIREACEALTLYVKAGSPKRTLPGLVKRRADERALCLEGLRETGK